MARNTSILLGDYFENFINEQIATGTIESILAEVLDLYAGLLAASFRIAKASVSVR